MKVLGIVNNTLYIAPFYGGDHDHSATITEFVKSDLIERGVPEFPSYDHIEALLLGMTHEEYVEKRRVCAEMMEAARKSDESSSNESLSGKSELPF
jgi:hypothetical protein